jgi:hypothetical protein
MQITCFNDQNTWTVGPVEIAAAKLRFALGFPEDTFFCPKCHKGNKVSKADFQAAMSAPPKPAVAAAPAPKPAGPAAPAPMHAPAQGFLSGGMPQITGSGPGPSIANPKHGAVVVRSLRVRKGHSKQDPVVAGLVKGERVEILATWTDGKDTWAQLGPDRWSAIVFNGEAMIDVDD